jgi:hypothetical protein
MFWIAKEAQYGNELLYSIERHMQAHSRKQSRRTLMLIAMSFSVGKGYTQQKRLNIVSHNEEFFSEDNLVLYHKRCFWTNWQIK